MNESEFPRFQIARLNSKGEMVMIVSLRKTYEEAKASLDNLAKDGRHYVILEVELKGTILEHQGKRVRVVPL